MSGAGRNGEGRAPRPVRDLLGELVERHPVSAAVALRGGPAAIDWTVAAGEREAGRALRVGDRFDLASLTKPFVATLALTLDRAEIVALDEPLAEGLPGVAPELAEATGREILSHNAGFQAWAPLYRRLRDPRRVLAWLSRGERLCAAPATYSDLGYIFWGLAVERRTGSSLWALLRRYVLEPLGARGVGAPGTRRDVVRCSLENAVEVELARAQGVRVALRGGPERGVVQDGNARFLGGLAGHAGLFGGADDLWRLGREWLRPGRLFDPTAVAEVLGGTGRFALAWRRRRRAGSGGLALSPTSFGHPGFTGGSLWLDPERQAIYVLLAHRSSTELDLDPWRRRFHRLASG